MARRGYDVRVSADWVIHTTMRRRWHDGTEFTIRPASPDEPRCLSATQGFHLTVSNPVGLKAHSWHPDVAAAKAHADEMLAGMTDRDIDAYREPVVDEQTEAMF